MQFRTTGYARCFRNRNRQTDSGQNGAEEKSAAGWVWLFFLGFPKDRLFSGRASFFARESAKLADQNRTTNYWGIALAVLAALGLVSWSPSESAVGGQPAKQVPGKAAKTRELPGKAAEDKGNQATKADPEDQAASHPGPLPPKYCTLQLVAALAGQPNPICPVPRQKPSATEQAVVDGNVTLLSAFVSVSALFVTIPEKTWGPDGTLESLVRAFETTGYTLRKHDLSFATDKETRPNYRVLFFTGQPRQAGKRRVLEQKESAYVVYLVEETPTSGIELAGLSAALADWDSLRQQGCPHCAGGELPFLAPAFSGSAPGLRRFLETQPAHRKVRTISGRATDYGIKQLLTIKDRATFHSTVHSDDDLQQAMFDYLQHDLHADCRKIALIVESSTPYGNANIFAKTDTSCRPRILPVPYDLAGVHAEWDRTKTVGPTPAFLPPDQLSQTLLERQQQETRRSGTFPLFRKDALNTRDLSLGVLLSTLYQEGIRYVGLMMTEPSDKLFLAHRISLSCPDVQLFSFESELSFTHPSDLQHTRGMLLASTYPLFTRNQQWTYPHKGGLQRLQFASQADQGVYNAALLLLGYPDLLLEYAPPFVSFDRENRAELREAKPPVWISAVGRGALLPLSVIPIQSTQQDFLATRRDASDRAFPVGARNIPNRQQRYSPYDLGSVRLLTLFLAGLTFLLGIPCLFNVLKRPLWVSQPGGERRFFDFLKPPTHPHPVPFAHENHSRGTVLLWLTVPLCFVSYYVGLILALRFRAGNHESQGFRTWFFRFVSGGSPWFESDRFLDFLFLLISTLGQGLCVVASLLALLCFCPRRPLWLPVQRWVLRPVVAGPFLLLIWALCMWLSVASVSALSDTDFSSWHGLSAILFLRRSAQTSSELSPLLPVLFLSAILCLWGLANLQRLALLLHHPPFALSIETPAHPTFPNTPPTDLADLPQTYVPRRNLYKDALLCTCQRTLGRNRTRSIVLAALVTVFVVSPVFSRLSTVDHFFFQVPFRLLFVLSTTLIVLAATRMIRTVWPLLRALGTLRHHPLFLALGRIPAAWQRPLGQMLLEEPTTASESELLEQKLSVLSETCAQSLPDERRQWIALPLHDSLQFIEERLNVWAAASTQVDPLYMTDEALDRAAVRVLYGQTRTWKNPTPPSAGFGTSPEQTGTPVENEAAQPQVPPGPTAQTNAATIPQAEDSQAGVAQTKSDPQLFFAALEDLLTARLLLFVSRVLPHVRNAMLSIAASMVLMLCALWTYPFLPMKWITIFVWFVFLLCSGLVAAVLVRLNRNPVLSLFSGTTPGRISLDSSFLRLVAYYVLLPLGSLLTTQLPEFSWLVRLLQQIK